LLSVMDCRVMSTKREFVCRLNNISILAESVSHRPPSFKGFFLYRRGTRRACPDSREIHATSPAQLWRWLYMDLAG